MSTAPLCPCGLRPAQTAGLCRVCYMRRDRDAKAKARARARAPKPEPQPQLSSTLLPWDVAEDLLAAINADIQGASSRRMERLGPRVVLERYFDPQRGISVQRLTVIERGEAA